MDSYFCVRYSACVESFDFRAHGTPGSVSIFFYIYIAAWACSGVRSRGYGSIVFGESSVYCLILHSPQRFSRLCNDGLLPRVHLPDSSDDYSLYALKTGTTQLVRRRSIFYGVHVVCNKFYFTQV